MTSTTTSHSGHRRPAFKKVLGYWEILAIGVGAMIGFGWVTLSGGWISSAGSVGASLALLVGGLLMAVVALVYSELVAAMPHAGGEHNYILRAMGSRWSFIGSWAIVGGYVAVVAFEAVAFPRTIAYVFPAIEQIPLWELGGETVYLLWALCGSAMAIVVTVINVLGVKLASAVQTFVVIFLFAIVLLQFVGVFVGGDPVNMDPLFKPGAEGVAGFITVLIVVPFMFVGFDVIPQTAEEANLEPRKIGSAAVTAVVIAAIFYALIVLGTATAMPSAELAEQELATADAMGRLFGSPIFANILIAGGIAGILTSWNSLQMGASRLVFSLAHTGMLPAWLGRLDPKYGTPRNALIAIGALAVVAPFLGAPALGWIVDSGSPSIVIAYLMVAISFVVLRRREPDMERPLRIGGPGSGGTVIGWIAAAICAGLIILYVPGMPATIAWQSYALFGAWWVIGLVLLLRVPKVPGSADAEAQLLRRAHERGLA